MRDGLIPLRACVSIVTKAAQKEMLVPALIPVLSPVLVGKLRPDELEQIAGEDELQKKKREELLQKVADLEKGKRILV